MGQYAVLLRFDEAADATFNRLKSVARDRCTYDATDGHPPHITFGVYENAEEAALCEWTRENAESHARAKISFASLGVFHDSVRFPETDVIYAVPASSKALIGLYYGFHEKFDECSGALGWAYTMAFGQPAVHATITLCKSAEFEGVFKSLYNTFSPFVATMTALEVWALPMRPVARYDLK